MNKSTFKFSISIFMILFLMACQNEKDAPAKMDGRLYTYADGSGNIYSLTANRIKYDPVTVVNSSSGTYSGGDPVDKKIDKQSYIKLKGLLDNAIADTGAHIEKRLKGSGKIVVSGGNQKRVKCILDLNNESKQEIERELQKMVE